MTNGRRRRTARAPGRVNLIGEHTDHAGGLVLPVAIDREIRVRFAIREDDRISIRSASRPGTGDLFDPAAPPDLRPGDWRSYARGVAALLAEEGLLTVGIDAIIETSLPERVGLSSSAALEVAVALALLEASETSMSSLELASLCREAEHRWAGVSCGIMDQIAVLLGRPDAALRIDCATGSVRPVALASCPFDLVVIDTGVRRALVESPYNDRVRECRAALGEACEDPLPSPLDRRRRHVLAESARVDRAVAALETGDLALLGELLDESHASLRDDLEVSWPEADLEVARAREAGAVGARMIGGGFGGSVLALFSPGSGSAYLDRPGRELLRPATGASVIDG